MRDPERIEEILTLIGRIWKANPDFRFQQLIYILQSEYSESNDQIGKVESMGFDGFKKVGYDLFNLEDDLFQKYLQRSLDHGCWGKNA
jgi:hypothetical protein